MPKGGDMGWEGLDCPEEAFHAIMDIAKVNGLAEAEELKGHFEQFGDNLPPELEAERRKLAQRLEGAPEVWKITEAA